MQEVIRLQLERGIFKHKAATFAEAEMLAAAGVEDILLAYHLVGPNVQRVARFILEYPRVRFAVIADHRRPIAELGAAMVAADRSVEVLLDVDTGLKRTGVPIGEAARDLYHVLSETRGVSPGGLHVYDGQNHQVDVEQRRVAVNAVWRDVSRFRDSLRDDGLPVPRVVAGATGSFPIFALVDDPTVELSPGTCLFHDVGYRELFPDLPFAPASLLLTRVVSRPAADRVTLDLGYKAVASDPPLQKRVRFPAIPDARVILQNEEHLVIQTSRAGDLEPGDEAMAIPYHACPTTALHKQGIVIRQARVAQRWDVAARDRWLKI